MDLYVVLGLGREASLAEIKRAYRRLARRYHPDINPGDRVAAARFQCIAEAYETLSDPDRRRQYDVEGYHAASNGPVAFGFEGFDFSVSVTGAGAPTFGDLFGDVLRKRGARHSGSEPGRGIDLHQTLIVVFEDAVRGVQRDVTATRQVHCRVCQGVGTLQIFEKQCVQCQGSGIVKSTRGHMVFSKPCDLCGGTGRAPAARCVRCSGRGVQTQTERLTLMVPPGVADGAQVRVPGKGNAGPPGTEPGDLVVTIRIEPHPLYQRLGNDIHISVPVAIFEAALGAKIEVPTPTGTARLRVPPGTQSGQQFRLRGRGMPSVRGGPGGDLIVEIRLVLPALLDERSKEILREFGRINADDVRKDLLRAPAREGRVAP